MNVKLLIMSIIFGLISIGWGLFLTYKILVHIQATELMWFVFYLYIPSCIVSGILMRVVNDGE